MRHPIEEKDGNTLPIALSRRLAGIRIPVYFLLWGSHARQKKALIDQTRHLILESPHPSPLSAYRGFFGTRHFSRANQFLQEQGRSPIEWQLPETP